MCSSRGNICSWTQLRFEWHLRVHNMFLNMWGAWNHSRHTRSFCQPSFLPNQTSTALQKYDHPHPTLIYVFTHVSLSNLSCAGKSGLFAPGLYWVALSPLCSEDLLQSNSTTVNGCCQNAGIDGGDLREREQTEGPDHSRPRKLF